MGLIVLLTLLVSYGLIVIIMDTEIKRLRDQWAKKLSELISERRNIDKQIDGLQQMLRGAAVLTEDPIPKEYTLGPIPLPPGLEDIRSLGLTDAIRLMLKNRPAGAMTAMGIRDSLGAYEYPLTQSNQMIAIHQVLAKLAKKGEIRKLPEEGKARYQWVSNVERALALDDPENPLYKSGIRPFPKQSVGDGKTKVKSKWTEPRDKSVKTK
jgi:hypothetical protein